MSFLFGRLASNPVLDVVFVVLGVQLLGICESDLIPIRFRIRRKCVKSLCLFVMVSRMVFVHMRLRANLRHRQRANTDGRGQPVECRPNDNGNSQRNGNQRATYNDFLINEQVNHRYGSNYVCSWRPINCKQCFGTCWRSTCARSRSKRPGSGKLDMLHTARLPFVWMARQKCSAF